MIGTVRMTEPGHQHGRRHLDAPGELREAERDGPLLALLDQEQQREEELVPGDHEDEQGVRGDGRQGQRQADVPHRLQSRAAVDGRRLLEAGRDGVEVVAQHVDRHRGDLGDVDDRQGE